MWITTPDVIAELDRVIADEIRQLMIKEGKVDAETGEWVDPQEDSDAR